ncbi:Gfo/Idh/MocA family oxidoreductase [Thalassospiraceae bacterium LMO-JJ14]|nr:Gfo/Idh/MocA family oxidoreductase [Thalassospiraceae bacterium LMO-JJ14]
MGVAVLGLGVGEQHAVAFNADPRTEIRWLIDLDKARASDVQSRIGAGQTTSALNTALDDPAVDIVSIASFDHMHTGQVLQCLEAGKHVFVEKPLCRTADELSSIIKAWQAAGQPNLASNLVLRDADLYRWLASEIAAGNLGRIYAIDGDYLYGRLEKITEGWRKDVPDYSVIEGGGIHLIDLMLMLSGERPTSVNCIGNRIASDGTGFNYDDFMAATYTFPSGLIGRITANFGCVHRHHHVLRVFGTEATFIYDDAGPRLHKTCEENRRAEPVVQNPLPASKGALIPAFIDAIESGADPAPQAYREFDLIRAVAATDTAHANHATQNIEYDT